jgi:gluconate 2-dehydrogenase gamma chain
MTNKTSERNIIPDTFANLDKWETNRRSFLRAALVAGAASQLAWFTSCSKQLEEANDYLTAEQSTVLKSILLIIFPSDGNGPSADDLNTFGYVMWSLADTFKFQEDKDYIIEGLDWASEKSQELYFDKYSNLDQEQKEALVKQFVDLKWGKNWMSVMVTLTMESVLLDPLYGGNVDEQGWNWLEHKPGLPRPTEKTRLESFMENCKPFDS